MNTKARTLCIAGALVVLLAALTPAALAGPLEGRWRLVEQNYGSGRANLVAGETPLLLEFLRADGKLAGRIGSSDRERDTTRRWPAVVSDGEARGVHVDELVVSPAEDRVVTRYRVDPPAGDDLVLHIVEEYRVVEDGGALVGEVTVSFRRDGEARGSYVLHRRFERAP